MLYNDYPAEAIEGFAISGTAYVLAPDDLAREQPGVYAFYRDFVFEGREYEEVVLDDKSHVIVIKE